MMTSDAKRLIPATVAYTLVEKYNADPDDDWTYKVVAVPENRHGLCYIEVYDDTGALLGTL